MKLVYVYTAKDEIDATLTKGFLENSGIKALISPENINLPAYLVQLGTSNFPYAVFVEEDKAEEAKKILAERG